MDRVLLNGRQMQALTSTLATLKKDGGENDVALIQGRREQDVEVHIYERAGKTGRWMYHIADDGYVRDLGQRSI